MSRLATPVAVAVLVVLVGCWPADSASPPIKRIKGKDGDFVFTHGRKDRRGPTVDHRTPDGSGGRTFVAVHPYSDWALEADVIGTKRDTVVYGVAIRSARRIRIGKVVSVPTLRYSARHRVRFFAARVPRRARRVKPNDIVALDARGRLLGRQHYNDGRGRFGACDGSWDRKHC